MLIVADPAGAVPLTTTGYSQDFDTLSNTGTTGSALPADWLFAESGSGANTTYGIGAGSSTTGNVYSFGAAGSTDRALGGLRTGTLSPLFGVSFENAGLTPLVELSLSYVGEQWRLGAVGRVDRLDFQYSLDATSLTSGTWIDVDALDFSTPNTTGAGAHDGNAAANRTSVSSAISGLSLAPAGAIWLRWLDLDAAGADDGLGIDNFQVSAVFSAPPRTEGTVPDSSASLGLLALSMAAIGLVAGRRRCKGLAVAG